MRIRKKSVFIMLNLLKIVNLSFILIYKVFTLLLEHVAEAILTFTIGSFFFTQW